MNCFPINFLIISFIQSLIDPRWALHVHFSIIWWPHLVRRAQRAEMKRRSRRLHSLKVVVNVSGGRHLLVGCRHCKECIVDSQAAVGPSVAFSRADTARYLKWFDAASSETARLDGLVQELAASEWCSHTVAISSRGRQGFQTFDFLVSKRFVIRRSSWGVLPKPCRPDSKNTRTG